MSKLLVLVSVSPGRRASTNDPLVAAAMATTLKEDKGGLDEIKRQLAVHIGSEEARHPQKLDKRERPELPKIPPHHPTYCNLYSSYGG